MSQMTLIFQTPINNSVTYLQFVYLKQQWFLKYETKSTETKGKKKLINNFIKN